MRKGTWREGTVRSMGRSNALQVMSLTDSRNWAAYNAANNLGKAKQRAKKKRRKKVRTSLRIFSLTVGSNMLEDTVAKARRITSKAVHVLTGLNAVVEFEAVDRYLGSGNYRLNVRLVVYGTRNTKYGQLRQVKDELKSEGVPTASAMRAMLGPRLSPKI